VCSSDLSKKRKHTDRKSDELDNEPSVEPPQWMSTDWSEQHTAERAAEREEPVIHPAADRARRAPNEIGNDHPHLFGKEGCPDQAVRPQDGLQGCLCKERGAGSSNEIRSDPDQPLRPGEAK
jgi:hypothetical protein